MRPEFCWYGGWWGFPGLTPGIMLIVVLIALYLLFRRGGSRPPATGGSDRGHAPGQAPESAMEILKRRYAGGEITREEFERIKKDIEG